MKAKIEIHMYKFLPDTHARTHTQKKNITMKLNLRKSKVSKIRHLVANFITKSQLLQECLKDDSPITEDPTKNFIFS